MVIDNNERAGKHTSWCPSSESAVPDGAQLHLIVLFFLLPCLIPQKSCYGLQDKKNILYLTLRLTTKTTTKIKAD